LNLVKLAKRVGRVVLRPDDRHDEFAELQRRFGVEPPLPSSPIRCVLVICHGNICRSPFAAALLARRLPALEVRSAGLFAGEGNPAYPAGLRIAKRFDIDLDSHRSAPIDTEMLSGVDLVLGMEGRHRAELVRRHPDVAARVRLLGHFLQSGPFTLPDPWGASDDVFVESFERISSATERLARLISASIDDSTVTSMPSERLT
jgi:protein-tyrosine phosphatase